MDLLAYEFCEFYCVTVSVPPESLQPIGDIVVTAGHSVQLSCPVLSDPEPDILWFFSEFKVLALNYYLKVIYLEFV